MNDHGHIEELAAARVLHALPPDEEAQVDHHAGICPPCKQMLEEAEETAHLLALTVQPARPPQHCKLRVMERIERERFLERPSRARSGVSPWALRGMAGVLGIALLLWNVQLRRDLSQTRMVEAMVVADTQPSPLKPQGAVATAASARMYMQPGEKYAVLVVDNLEPAPAGKVYQVWVADEYRQRPMHTFQAADRHHPVVMWPTEPLTSYKWIMITLEDAGGSTTPSDQRVLFGDL